MGRLAYQVLVIPYLRGGSSIRYCVFERKSPKHQIQFIAGGGEDNETPLQSAKREMYEESGISNAEFQQLSSMCCIPANVFSEKQRQIWGESLFVIPEYAFGAEVKTDCVKLSDEHTAYEWVSYDGALTKLKWDSNKTALYELNSKLII